MEEKEADVPSSNCGDAVVAFFLGGGEGSVSVLKMFKCSSVNSSLGRDPHPPHRPQN